MRSQLDQSFDSFVSRRLSQLKVLSRLIEHELMAGKPGQALTLDRELGENLLDLLEVFIEDNESRAGGKRERERDGKAEPKAVTRLN